MNCTLFCTSYLLGVSPSVLAQEIGHDGSEILWSEYDDCRKFRGFCLPEMQTCFFMRGKLLAPIFVNPIIAPGEDAKAVHIWTPEECGRRYYAMTKGRKGIIMGELTSGIGHALVYDNGYIDPRTRLREESTPLDYRIREAYVVCDLINY